MIYFAQSVAGGPVKIGTTQDLDARLRQLEAHYGRPLAVLATLEGGYEEERAIHARFDHLRLKGPGKRGAIFEQFRPAADLMAFIGRPLLVGANPEALEAMGSDRLVIAHIKGTPEYATWLDQIHDKTHIPKAALFRLALAEWATRNGHPAPPEL